MKTFEMRVNEVLETLSQRYRTALFAGKKYQAVEKIRLQLEQGNYLPPDQVIKDLQQLQASLTPSRSLFGWISAVWRGLTREKGHYSSTGGKMIGDLLFSLEPDVIFGESTLAGSQGVSFASSEKASEATHSMNVCKQVNQTISPKAAVSLQDGKGVDSSKKAIKLGGAAFFLGQDAPQLVPPRLAKALDPKEFQYVRAATKIVPNPVDKEMGKVIVFVASREGTDKIYFYRNKDNVFDGDAVTIPGLNENNGESKDMSFYRNVSSVFASKIARLISEKHFASEHLLRNGDVVSVRLLGYQIPYTAPEIKRQKEEFKKLGHIPGSALIQEVCAFVGEDDENAENLGFSKNLSELESITPETVEGVYLCKIDYDHCPIFSESPDWDDKYINRLERNRHIFSQSLDTGYREYITEQFYARAKLALLSDNILFAMLDKYVPFFDPQAVTSERKTENKGYLDRLCARRNLAEKYCVKLANDLKSAKHFGDTDIVAIVDGIIAELNSHSRQHFPSHADAIQASLQKRREEILRGLVVCNLQSVRPEEKASNVRPSF